MASALLPANEAQLAERFVFIPGGGIREEERAFLADIPNQRLEKPSSNQNLRETARRLVGSFRRGELA